MSIKTRQPFFPAAGYKSSRSGARRVAITFDQHSFEAISDMAEGCEISFAEMVRTLIQAGLKSLDDL